MLYPVAEFRRRSYRAIRHRQFTFVAAVVTVALFGVTGLELSDPWGRHEPARRIVLTWGTIAAAGVTLLLECLWRTSRHPFTVCPHCHHPLTSYPQIVVASGCCYSCGGRVLISPESSPADTLIPRAEYLAADTGFQSRAIPVLIGGVITTYLGCAGAFVVVEWADLPDALAVVVFLALTAVAPVSAVAVLRWVMAVGRRNPALVCPSCGKLLEGGQMLVASTGNCTTCGCPAVGPRVRPLAPPHLGSLWTIPQLTQIEHLRRQATLWVFGWIAAVIFVTLWLIELHNVCWNDVWGRDLGFNPQAARWVERNGVLMIGIGGAVTGVFVLRHLLRAVARKHPIDCPRCGRELLTPFARATRCCNQCGWRVVAG